MENEMKPLFICYPKCSTCGKAAEWLRQHGIDFEMRNIVEQNPTADELQEWIARSGLPVSRFFNTSGLRYRALGLKDRVKSAPQEELIELLSSDGMLVKRPLLLLPDKVLVGFREAEWSAALLGDRR